MESSSPVKGQDNFKSRFFLIFNSLKFHEALVAYSSQFACYLRPLGTQGEDHRYEEQERVESVQ
mgnify:CR=1 FL=1